MILLYVLFACLTLYGITYKKKGWHDDYMGKSQCNAIKGLCIILVFIRHIFQYINESGYDYSLIGDHYAEILDGMTRQLLVAFFLFSSGYGIMESIKRKGVDYIKVIPKRRILTTLLNFDVAVLAFILLDIIIGERLTIGQIALSFIAWDSIGNSCWYIFTILCCYLIVYISYVFSNKYEHLECGLYITIILCIVYLLFLSEYKTSCWYDTIFCYPYGMLYSFKQNTIERIIRKYYGLLLFISLMLIAVLYCVPDYKGLLHNSYSIILCLFIAALTMKVKIGNKAIYWMGINLFPLYIYQRLPMIALYNIDEGGFVRDHLIMYITGSAVVVLLIAYLYKYWQIKLS